MAKCSFVWKILGVCLTVTLIAANNIQIQRNQDLNFTKNDRYLPKQARSRSTTLNKYETWGHPELIEGGGIVYARGKVRIRNPFRKSDKTYSAPDSNLPPMGGGHILTRTQIRYCLAEDIRLAAARDTYILREDSAKNGLLPIEDLEKNLDKFNAKVTNYNGRCGSYRYYEDDRDKALATVNLSRSKYVAEGQQIFD